jgi:hypothetical protein
MIQHRREHKANTSAHGDSNLELRAFISLSLSLSLLQGMMSPTTPHSSQGFSAGEWTVHTSHTKRKKKVVLVSVQKQFCHREIIQVVFRKEVQVKGRIHQFS